MKSEVMYSTLLANPVCLAIAGLGLYLVMAVLRPLSRSK